jgi:hypothetical protein
MNGINQMMSVNNLRCGTAVLKLYFEYCERTRTHLFLDKDAPIPRKVRPSELGKVVELPQVGYSTKCPPNTATRVRSPFGRGLGRLDPARLRDS